MTQPRPLEWYYSQTDLIWPDGLFKQQNPIKLVNKARKGMRDSYGPTYRLNMELDLQSLFGLHVHSCTLWLWPRNYPTRALLVSQDTVDDISS
jgi:hypothetical protein